MTDMNRRETGSRYEKQAAVFLEQKGYEILEMNFRCRRGEIDLVARDGEYLVFVEGKYRADLRCGRPAEAVTPAKIQRIRTAALYYLTVRCGGRELPCRFDVVEILGGHVNHIKNAF